MKKKSNLLIEQLIERGTVEMPPDDPILIHVPTGAQFNSTQNLAHYHYGWKAGVDDQSTG